MPGVDPIDRGDVAPPTSGLLREYYPRLAYDIAGAAFVMSVSQDTIRRAIHASDPNAPIPPLHGRRVGAKYLISAEDLVDWYGRLPEA